MKEKLIKILVAMGISQANAELIADPEGDVSKVDESTLISEFKSNQLALHENDKDLIKKIESATVGRERDNFERKIRQSFGLTTDEIKDKKLEEIIKLAQEKANSNSNKTVEQLQNELLEKTNRIKALEETEIPNIKGEVDRHKKLFNINDKLTKKVLTHKLRNPLNAVMATLQAELDNEYDADLDDKGEIVHYLKGTKLLPKNADGTKFLTTDDILKLKLEANKYLEESNADLNPGSDPLKVRNTAAKSEIDTTKFPGYEAAKKNLEALKIKP